MRFLRFCWDFCKFTIFTILALTRCIQQIYAKIGAEFCSLQFFCNCYSYCYHYFSQKFNCYCNTTFLKNIIATLLANFFNPFSRFKRKKTLWILLENPQKFPPIVIHWKEKNFKVVIIATMVATCNELLHHKANQVQIKYIKCTFSSNKIVQKISFSLCFWAPDLLFDRFY